MLLVYLVSLSSVTLAENNRISSSEVSEFDVNLLVDDTLLDKMRGGFITSEGLRFDIGIDRAIYKDGILQSQNSFAANNIHFNGQTVIATNLQNSSSEIVTIIQNSQNNTAIKIATGIDVNVRNFGTFMESMKGVEAIRSGQDIQISK